MFQWISAKTGMGKGNCTSKILNIPLYLIGEELKRQDWTNLTVCTTEVQVGWALKLGVGERSPNK